MTYKDIAVGRKPPDEVNVIIENSIGGVPVKYELDKKSGLMFVDRFLNTAMRYPGNYGFVPHTLSEDGDPVDVLVIGPTPVMPGAVIAVTPVAVLKMEDEKGMDEKIIAVPVQRLNPYHADIKDLADIDRMQCDQIEHFFKHYKDLEKGKWSRVNGWGDAAEARKLIQEGIAREQSGKGPQQAKKGAPPSP